MRGLEEYMDLFPGNVLLLEYARTFADLPNAVERVLGFLGVAQRGALYGTRRNRSGRPRFRALHRALSTKGPIKEFAKLIIGKERTRWIRGRIDALNLRPLTMQKGEREYAGRAFRKEVSEFEHALRLFKVDAQ